MSVVGEELASRLTFPTGFLWGAATASYQVEGSTTVDGRIESIWDTFCRRPGAVEGGDTGEPGADHYRRYSADVDLMGELGMGAYRFSLAWPRIRREGGGVNPLGLDFYDRLVDRLLLAGITPWATLYHWDLPQELEERGGWANRDVAYQFAEFAESVLLRIGDRVPYWTTLNEPWCSAFLGYAAGEHAPGRREPRAAAAAVHHLLLGHGLAMEAIRGHARLARAGITLNLFPVRPSDVSSAEDTEVARRVDGLQNRIFLDPLLYGDYPADVLADLEPLGFGEWIRPGDRETIAAPLDVLGVNYYRGYEVTATPSPRDELGGAEWICVPDFGFVPDDRLPRTDVGWQVQPDGLAEVLLRVHREYPRIPLYITENGAAYPDVVGPDGRVEDHDRIAYLDSHLRAAHSAIAQGVDLRGYFYWSLLDNFEWAKGYAKRFGLVHVDYETQVRTPKDSAHWYAKVARQNALGG